MSRAYISKPALLKHNKKQNKLVKAFHFNHLHNLLVDTRMQAIIHVAHLNSFTETVAQYALNDIHVLHFTGLLRQCVFNGGEQIIQGVSG